ncbi:MAG: biopolymer transporter ExbD [Paracoccus sp. (in: a-proteobacteria)]|nr:biopolymer transporter ExbD [Paracoccus sp. (in: a-proteobacteria)]
MRIDMPPRRPRAESIIPMINVVFLLLVFFVLTAQIAPSTPFEVDPPESEAEIPAQDIGVLYISSEGALAYDDARGDAVWPLIAARSGDSPLEIRADGGASGVLIASILKRLRQETETPVQLIVRGG